MLLGNNELTFRWQTAITKIDCSKVGGGKMKEKLIKLLKEVLEEESELDVGVDPIADLGMDSVDIVDYVLRIEEEFGCNFDEFEPLSQNMKTVGEMIDYLVLLLKDAER